MHIMTDENETPKISKTEEKESYIKQLRENVDEIKKLRDEIQGEREKYEELRARQILGGKTDGGVQPEPVKPDTPQDYIRKVLSGEIQLEK